jgi:tol-pal system protein YbgF
MKPWTFFILTFFFALTACAPQAELVKTQSAVSNVREDTKATKTQVQELQRRLDALDENIKGSVDAQKVMADYGAKTDQLTMDIQLLQGKLEENNFRIQEFAQKLDDKSFKISELTARVDELEARIKSLATGTSSVLMGPAGTLSDKDKNSAAKAVEPSEAYRQAMNDYNSGNFDLALAGFNNYLTQFPATSQADKAQYWIGECFYSKKEYARAIEEFTKVLKNHPKSEKVAGARLKIGFSLSERKKHREGQRVFKQGYQGTSRYQRGPACQGKAAPNRDVILFMACVAVRRFRGLLNAYPFVLPPGMLSSL